MYAIQRSHAEAQRHRGLGNHEEGAVRFAHGASSRDGNVGLLGGRQLRRTLRISSGCKPRLGKRRSAE